jgi:transcriptional regulator
MHVPAYYRITDEDIIYQFIEDNSFGVLISKGDIYPTATHIPIELTKIEGTYSLRGHISKANPQWKEWENNPETLAIFQSPIHDYISASWYNHENVSTWNYMSVHVQGKIRILNQEELWQSLKALTDKYEKDQAQPIAIENLSPQTMKQIHGIVGFDLSIDHIDCAFKMSQNRNDEDYLNIIQQLRNSNKSLSVMMAEHLEKIRS